MLKCTPSSVTENVIGNPLARGGVPFSHLAGTFLPEKIPCTKRGVSTKDLSEIRYESELY